MVQTTKYEWSNGVDRGVDFNDIGFKDVDVSVYMVTTYDTAGSWSRTYYDSLQRVIRVVTKGDKNKDIITDTVYDAQGRVIGKTLPYYKGHFAGDRANWIRYYYDILGRVVKQVTPIHDKKSQVTTYSFNGLSSTITTPKEHKKNYY